MKFRYIIHGLLTSLILTASMVVVGQIGPTAAPGAWQRNANTIAGGGGNVFGTRSWNSPVFFHTANNIATPGIPGLRMKLNGAFGPANQYPIAGYNWGDGINTAGYLGLGNNSFGLWSTDATPFAGTHGPFSLLHLNGRYGTFVQTGGFRPWMKTGITYTDNQDLSYMGLRRVGPDPGPTSTASTDVTETVIAWADNAGLGSGPDELAFRFTSGVGNTAISVNMNRANDLDGKMIAQFRPNGNMGLGPFFEPGTDLAKKPQSRLHLTKMNGAVPVALNANPNELWAQLTNSHWNGTPINGGPLPNQRTGHTANDGIRLGLIGRNGYLRHQEIQPFIIQTDWDNGSGGTNNGERMRISSVGAPGVPNPPFVGGNNITRVSISHLGNNPITVPRSLLHMGTNLGVPAVARNWMDVGTMSSRANDLTYFGLKGTGIFSSEAVMAWGNAAGGPTVNGPMRVLYTSDAGGLGPGPEGLEIARFDPTASAFGGATTPANPNGKLGVGDFTATAVTHKLHVRGNGRFEHIPIKTNGNQLIIGQQITGPNDLEFQRIPFSGSPTDVLLGDCTWGPVPGSTDDQQIQTFNFDCVTNILTYTLEDGGTATADFSCLAGGGGSFNAHNGTSLSTLATNHVAFGQNLFEAGNPGELLNDRQVPMNDNNIYFTDVAATNPAENRIAIGTTATPAKLNVTVSAANPGPNPRALELTNNQTAPGAVTISEGVRNTVDGVNTLNRGELIVVRNGTTTGNVGSEIDVNSGTTGFSSAGVVARAFNGSSSNVAVSGSASSLVAGGPLAIFQNVGVEGLARDGRLNYGGKFSASGAFPATTGDCYGVQAAANGANPTATNYGVFGSASGAGTNWAMYSNGDQFSTTSAMWTIVSDRKMKNEIQDLDVKALETIEKLQPKSYIYKHEEYPHMNLPKTEQWGFVAQEVEQVIPEMVRKATHPAQLDDKGNVIHESVSISGINYDRLIPLLVKAAKEQKSQVDSLTVKLEDLNARLEQLESLLGSTGAVQPRTAGNNAQQVTLENAASIILDQNVPNPFAENTTVTFVIPETVAKAQMHFYDQTGRIINTIDITQRGEGSLKVFGENLSNGIYTYSLVADGKVIDSKKMIKTR